MIDAIINRGKIIIDCLNVELAEIRSKLDISYDGNKDRFFDNIKASVNNNLKPFFEASNSKLLRLQNNYFEDRIDTEYEIQDTVSDEYINSYLQINCPADANKTNDSNIKKNHNSANFHPANKNLQVHSSFNNENNYNNNKKRKFQNNNNNNNKNNHRKNSSSNSNWHNNNHYNYQNQQRFHYNNQKVNPQSHNYNQSNTSHNQQNINNYTASKPVNFHLATNHKNPP